MTFKSNLFEIGLTLILFSVPIVFFFAFLITSYRKFGYFDFAEISIFWIPFTLINIITVPGILLHIKYTKIEKGRFLVFNKKGIEITREGLPNKILYKNILKAEVYFVAWNRQNPWSKYGFTRVVLKDGSSFLYTSLIFDCFSSALLYKQNNINVEEVETLWPWPKEN